MPLSADAAKIVRSTARAFGVFGPEIAQATYARLAADSEARIAISDETMRRARHPEQFGGDMMAFASNIDRLDQVSNVVDQVARRHVQDGVKPEHYRYVEKALLLAIRDVLGEGATDQVLDAWRESFVYLSDLLIARERELSRRRPAAKAA